MSGGSHSYVYHEIERELVGQMYDDELNDLIRDIAELAHDLEWYDSSDYNKERYEESVQKFKNKWFEKSRNERLKDYIDESINKLKNQLYTMIGVKNE